MISYQNKYNQNDLKFCKYKNLFISAEDDYLIRLYDVRSNKI